MGLSPAYIEGVGKGGDSFANRGVFYASRLLSFLEKRHRTFLNILRFAVVYQKQHLNGGALMQLTMKEAAGTLSLHPSTVCRTVGNKYVEFEGRVFCAASLFDRSGKDGLSKGFICEQLQKLWQEEGTMSN